MPSVVHVVVTKNFAGAERYVSDVANETADRGWSTSVIGGDPRRMPDSLGRSVRWLPGRTPLEALASLARLRRQDVCHAHMTLAETVSIAARPLHRGAVVATRHFAAPRGSTVAGRMLAPWIGRRLSRQIAISEFVASRLERSPDVIIRNGVRQWPCLWRAENRTVLVLQRLEPEKDTATALAAWHASGLGDKGWSLRIVGDGSERSALERKVSSEGIPSVTFTGWASDVSSELAGAGAMLAPAPAEPFGLAVLEAMAAGVPVVAAAAGGHLETIGEVPGAPLFPPGDVAAAAHAMRSVVAEGTLRCELSRRGRELAQTQFTIARHVDRLIVEYGDAIEPTRAGSERLTEMRAP